MLKRKKQVMGEADIANAQIDEPTQRKPLRLWPGVAIVVLQWLAWYAIPLIAPGAPEAMMYGMFAVLACGPAVLIWWAFFSRVPRFERWGAVALVIGAMAATPLLLHESVAKGNFGFQFISNAIPVVSLAFVVWAVASQRLSGRFRRATMVVTILLACGAFTLVRSKGLTGAGFPEFAWRWSETPEEGLLARAGSVPIADSPAQAVVTKTLEKQPPSGDKPVALASTPADMETGVNWPGYRGPDRDGIIPGVRIETDWAASPPVELWRRPIGPGVSSFAVHGDLLYTQEQRGEDEVVACYKVSTGEPVWQHRDTARFWDSHVGAGPRATPALGGGRVYALGATGILNALDATDGRVVWSRNAASDTEAKVPYFGFTSSPLVVDDVVIVNTKALVAYDLVSGSRRWTGPASGSFSSPHLVTLDGVLQILLLSHAGVTSVTPADGTLLWKYPLPGLGIIQPALTAEGDLLISEVTEATAMPIGTRRLAVAKGAGRWMIEERWRSNRLKPTFSPIVVHEGHAFGFDGRILACINLEDGKLKWKGGRYGSGQVLLLPDQDVLLVVSERGELALVRAAPDRFTELARFPAIEGRTWNQPALVGDILLVRNGQEMAAFRLSLMRS